MDSVNILLLIFLLLFVFLFWILLNWICYKKFSSQQKKQIYSQLYGAFSSLFTGFASVGIIFTVFLHYKEIKIDSERQKKQETIQMLLDFQKTYKPYELRLQKSFMYNIADRSIIYSKLTDSLKFDARLFLSFVEHISVGVNTSVYDIELIYWISGPKFIRWYNKLSPCIAYYRIVLKDKTAYSEYTNMVINLIRLQNKYRGRFSSIN